jgi:nucleoid-associated protein YgaU
MGLLSFIKDAGEKLFGIGKANAAPAAQAAPDTAAADQAAASAIVSYIEKMGLKVEGLDVQYASATETVTVSGLAPNQDTREKVVLCCGNVAHVAQVNDLLAVAAAEPESKWYTVVQGDNLSKISKIFYETPNKYMLIFEANKPMLSHPDKIYPGQVLRIPSQ